MFVFSSLGWGVATKQLTDAHPLKVMPKLVTRLGKPTN